MSYYTLRKEHFRLLQIKWKSLGDYHVALDIVKAEQPELYAYHMRCEERERRRRRKFLPNPGRSETIMRNRVLRAKGFGLQHDGLYNSPVNRG